MSSQLFFSLSLSHPPSSSTNEFLFCLITDERERASVGGGDKGSKKSLFWLFFISLFSLNFSRRAAFSVDVSLQGFFFTLKKRWLKFFPVVRRKRWRDESYIRKKTDDLIASIDFVVKMSMITLMYHFPFCFKRNFRCKNSMITLMFHFPCRSCKMYVNLMKEINPFLLFHLLAPSLNKTQHKFPINH